MEAKMIQLYADNEMTMPASPVVSEQTVFDGSGEASIPKMQTKLDTNTAEINQIKSDMLNKADKSEIPAIPDSLPASDVYPWAKQPNKPTYTAEEVGALPASTTIPAMPTKTSQLENDSGFLTAENDPTVPSWAKANKKPTYTASEVGALAVGDIAAWAKSPTKPTYTASEVGALPNTTVIPTIPDSLPASDVPAWAKQPSKPTYTSAEVGALPLSRGADITANEAEIAELKTEVSGLPNNSTLISNVADSLKEQMPLVKSAEQPEIVNDIAEMTDTSKFYVLSSDGFFYTFKPGTNYNLLKLNDVSYSSRLQDDVSGIISSTAYNAVTGWIPVQYGKNYCMSFMLNGARNYQRVGLQRMNLKLADGTIIVYNRQQVPQTASESNVIRIEYENAVEMMLHFALTNASAQQLDIGTQDKLRAYLPMMVEGEGTADTINKATTYEYVDGDAQAPDEWYNTGLAYNQPADYENRIIQLESDVTELKGKNGNGSTSPYCRNVNWGNPVLSYYKGLSDSYGRFSQNTQYGAFMTDWKAVVANHSGYVEETQLGTASDGQAIYVYDFKPIQISNKKKKLPKLIIIGCQHGFEKSNVYGMYYFIDNLLNKWSSHPSLEYLRNHVELMIVPVLNTYGFDNLSYKNANGVNLNRNYDSNWVLVADATSDQYGGAAPFDQPETQIVRDLINGNKDALMVVDFHTNGGGSVDAYNKINYYGICESTDDYYNRLVDAVDSTLSSISANFNLDYALEQPDTLLGFLNNSNGTGLLRGWATDNGVAGVLVEGFNGFPGQQSFSGEVLKANEEILANWLVNAIVALSR